MPPKATLQTDFCVIGAGSGGLFFAAGAAQLGASVVLIERAKMGGDCLNTGCVPSKALIRAAKAGHHLKQAGHFGWEAPPAQVDFEKVHAYVQGVIAQIAPHDSVERFEGLGVRVLREEGRFLDPTTLETQTHHIIAKRFILAPGSRPFIPDIEGLKDVPYLTNETIFDLKELPRHLAILGGGPIAVELAQAFARLGSQVSVLQSRRLLPRDESEMVNTLKNILVKEGISIYEHVRVLKVQKSPQGLEVVYATPQAEQTLNASHLLVAAGRRPDIEALNLASAGVEATPMGIVVNQHLQTTNARIYAIGDCTGGYQFTHAAGYHAQLVLRRALFKLPTKMSTRALPWVTYTDPELAHVGFTQEQLRAQGKPYTVLEGSFEDNDRARADFTSQGHMKVLVTPRGRLLGVTILGAHAGELIYPWVMAQSNNMSLAAFTKTVAPYPTLSEIHRFTAGRFYTQKLFSPLMKKIVQGLLRMTS